MGERCRPIHSDCIVELSSTSAELTTYSVEERLDILPINQRSFWDRGEKGRMHGCIHCFWKWVKIVLVAEIRLILEELTVDWERLQAVPSMIPV